jgi:cell division septation protein DedD
VAAVPPRQGAPPAPPSVEVAGECPRCGSPYTSEQEYCLECGLRLPAPVGVVGRLGSGWRRRLRWYPGDWLWPALLFLLLAAAGAGASILFSNRNEPAETLVATAPPGQTTGLAPTSATPPSPAAPPATTTSARTTTQATTARPTPQRQTKPIGWPTGRRGYTVVLASIPRTRGRPAAVDQADRAMAAGLQGVGILDSSSYSSLHPGYFVIFTGIRDSDGATARDLSAAQTNGYPAAYVRQVTP